MYISRVILRNEYYPTQQHYPFNIGLLQNTASLDFSTPVTFFVGENGSGKSTLLHAIAKKCDVVRWEKPKRHLAHQNPYEDRLSDFLHIDWIGGRVPGAFFQAETFHELADFLDDVAICDPGRLKYHGGHILNTLSHGEGMLSYFSGRYNIKGLYFLDEPEAALSPASQLKFLNLLQRLALAGHAQFIIATHSPILLSCQGSRIYSFNSETVKEVSYEETEHYQIYKAFFMEREARLAADQDHPAEFVKVHTAMPVSLN